MNRDSAVDSDDELPQQPTTKYVELDPAEEPVPLSIITGDSNDKLDEDMEDDGAVLPSYDELCTPTGINLKGMSKYDSFDLQEHVLEDLEHVQDFVGFVSAKGKQYFVDNIPLESIKELPQPYFAMFAGAAYLLSAFLFIAFCYINYVAEAYTDYISLDYDNGCSTIPIDISGSFYCDTHGHWQGESEFEWTNSPYEVTFQELRVSGQPEYGSMMESFKANIITASQIAKNQNMAFNLVIWMSYLDYYSVSYPLLENFETIGYGQLQYFQLVGLPSVVFNSKISYGSVSSAVGVCNTSTTTSYDEANALMTLSFNDYSIQDVTTESACGYSIIGGLIESQLSFLAPSLAQQAVDINVKVESFSTSLAVNYGMLPLSYLSQVEVLTSFEFRNTTFEYASYIDIRYPRMDVIYCVENLTALPEDLEMRTADWSLCMVKIGNVLALPLFNHIGGSLATPQECTCDAMTVDDTLNSTCNNFRVMTSLMYFSGDVAPDVSTVLNSVGSNDPELIMRAATTLARVIIKYENYSYFNSAAFDAMHYSVAKHLETVDDSIDTQEYRNSAFQFCELDSPTTGDISTCNLVTFFKADSVTTISEYKLHLDYAACSESPIFVGDEAWNRMIEIPPDQLVQDYYSCHTTWWIALLNAVGIALGNMQILMTLFVVFLLPIIYGILSFIQEKPVKKEFTDEQLKAIQEALCTVLLRVTTYDKDSPENNNKSSKDMPTPGGVLDLLGTELKNMVVESTYNWETFEKDLEEIQAKFALESKSTTLTSEEKEVMSHMLTRITSERAALSAAAAAAAAGDEDDDDAQSAAITATNTYKNAQHPAGAAAAAPPPQGGRPMTAVGSNSPPGGAAAQYPSRPAGGGVGKPFSRQAMSILTATKAKRMFKNAKAKQDKKRQAAAAAAGEVAETTAAATTTTPVTGAGASTSPPPLSPPLSKYGSMRGFTRPVLPSQRSKSRRFMEESPRAGTPWTDTGAVSKLVVLNVISPGGDYEMDVNPHKVVDLQDLFPRLHKMMVGLMRQSEQVASYASSSSTGSSSSTPQHTAATTALQAAFRDATKLSQELMLIEFSDITGHDEAGQMLLLLCNTLCMHASLYLRQPMKRVAQHMDRQVAYRIGSLALTYRDLCELEAAILQ